MVLPARCGGCGAQGPSPCHRCVEEMGRGGWVTGLDVPVVAAVAYTGAARDLVVALKYRRRREALAWMADAVVAAVTWAGVMPELVTWVPASRSGRRRRGFDQAALLASAVGARLERPVAGVLRRTDDARQVGRDRAGRAVGASGIVCRPGAARTVAGRRVLVVDDVVTTGASMRSAAAALAGAQAVAGAAFAHKR